MIFSGRFNKTFQENLLVLVHAVKRGNQKGIRNNGFKFYLNMVQKINPPVKGSLNQRL